MMRKFGKLFRAHSLVRTLTEALRKQPVIWANAHIPLNLNLLCGILEDAIKKTNIEGLTQGLAQLSSMTRMYQLMEEKLYERSYGRHDIGPLKAGRRLIRAQIDFIKHYQKERLFLAKLAFQSFEAERIIIPMRTVGVALQSYVDKEITQGFQQNIQQEKEKLAEVFFENVCGLGLIKPVLDAGGLSQSEQDYEFLHLTFQEYYTAIYIAEGLSSEVPQARGDAEKVILKEKYNPRWQIVWWFVAGLLRENAPANEAYLKQLQGECRGQTVTHDVLEHYQLSLLARCIDESLPSNNHQTIESTVQDLQRSFLTLYQIAKNLTRGKHNNNGEIIKELGLIKSPFFSACRMSPNLCAMTEKRDLYALIPAPTESEEKLFLSRWIETVQVVTPKALLMLARLLADKDSETRRAAVEAAGRLGAAAATPKLLDALEGLLADEDEDRGVRYHAAEAVGEMGAAVTPKLLDALVGLLNDGLLNYRNWNVSSAAAEAVGKLCTAATPKLLDALVRLLAYKDEGGFVCSAAAEAVGRLGTAGTPKLLDALVGLLAGEDSYARRTAVKAAGSLGAAAATPKLLDALRACW